MKNRLIWAFGASFGKGTSTVDMEQSKALEQAERVNKCPKRAFEVSR